MKNFKAHAVPPKRLIGENEITDEQVTKYIAEKPEIIPNDIVLKKLEADGKIIRIQAGENGSIQGPAEAKWGYTVPVVAEWDGDDLPDIVVNSIWGKVVWYRNRGTRQKPVLEAARPIVVDWPGPPPKPAWL